MKGVSRPPNPKKRFSRLSVDARRSSLMSLTSALAAVTMMPPPRRGSRNSAAMIPKLGAFGSAKGNRDQRQAQQQARLLALVVDQRTHRQRRDHQPDRLG
jgi:hypothetical protein